MTRGHARIHLDASIAGQVRQARCGWAAVDTDTDISRVTCRTCLDIFAGRRAGPRGDQRSRGRAAGLSVVDELVSAFAATLAPTAGPPPRMTPQLWAASCQGAEHRRCGSCVLCEWERVVEMYAFGEAWQKRHQVARPEGAPRWSSLSAALVALAEWERHDRHGPSAFGGILRRIESGEIGDSGKSRPDDPLMRRAGELVRVRQALELAFPEGGHALLSAGACKAVLMARTPGVLVAVPSYEDLAGELGVAEGELRALVRNGRRLLTEELGERCGLIPLGGGRRKGTAASVMRAGEEAAWLS